MFLGLLCVDEGGEASARFHQADDVGYVFNGVYLLEDGMVEIAEADEANLL